MPLEKIIKHISSPEENAGVKANETNQLWYMRSALYKSKMGKLVGRKVQKRRICS